MGLKDIDVWMWNMDCTWRSMKRINVKRRMCDGRGTTTTKTNWLDRKKKERHRLVGDRRGKEYRCVYNKKKCETFWEASALTQRRFIVDISEGKVDWRRSSYNYLVRWVHLTTGFTCYRLLNNTRQYSWQRNLAVTGKV